MEGSMIWSGKITLPGVFLPKEKIGHNFVEQLLFDSCQIEVRIFESEFNGFDVIKTNLDSPLDKILLRKKGAKKKSVPKTLPWLICQEEYDPSTLNEGSRFSWENLGSLDVSPKTPSQILESWKNKFVFKREDPTKNEEGLRSPQIGAIHAISAHFSVGDTFEPATIVLPTGTGKTETMLATLFYTCCPKLLVIVPSDALRSQIQRKFLSLGILPLVGVVPFLTNRPKVATIKKGIQSVEDAKQILEKANVIIATPNILQSSDPEAVSTLCLGCSDLFVDEAHHVSARTWHDIKQRFLDKKIVQFTATPFRNDGKDLQGKIIFNYKLGNAQRDGYYKPIRLFTLNEYGDQEEIDEQIAKKALAILREDISNGHNHLLMARVDKQTRAEDLVQLYQRLAPDLHPEVVYSGSGRKTLNRKSLNSLLSGRSKVVVCVNMLGEGFDLPNLKVAAIHDGHKSLAISLQFIGRFTRKAMGVGMAAAVINTGDPKAEKNIQKLYSEGADWDELLKRFSEEKIEKEVRLHEVVDALKEKGNLHNEISLWNLNPNLTIQIYKTNCTEWDPEKYSLALPANFQHWHSISESKKLLIVLGLQETKVKWGSHQKLIDVNHKLLIAYWHKEDNVLFVYANDYSGMRVEKIAEVITNDSAELIHGSKIFNVLNNVELPLVKNLGSSKIGAISFTSYFGPNVTEGLAAIEKSESELNNIACLGYEDGERVLWGCTQRKGKVWAVGSGTVAELMEWCLKTWKKVNSDETDETNIVRDFLRPEKMDAMYTKPVISIQWGEHIQSKYSDRVHIIFEDVELPLYLIEIELHKQNDDNIELKISSDSFTSIYKFQIDASFPKGYEYSLKSGKRILIKYGKSGIAKPLEEHVISDPFILRYSDGTYSYNNYHIPISLNAGEFPKEAIEVWDWGSIPLNQESMGKGKNKNTIQFKTFKEIEDSYDFIFNDDGGREAADLVALREIDDDLIELCLIHCKNAKGGVPSGEIENLYTVCGQAQKSIRVKHNGLQQLQVDFLRRESYWKKDGASRLLKGSFRKLAYFVQKSRKSKITFVVIIVQPGLKKELASPEILKLLGTTELYLKKTTEAQFRVIGS